MLGLRTRPSSRALTDALNLLNAVGSDKAKVKILEEIKQAQAKYEAVVELSREAKKAADQSRAEAEKALAEARTAQANASKAYDAFLREKEESSERLAARDAELRADAQSLEVQEEDFNKKMKRENAELDNKRAALGDVEQMKKQAHDMMKEAEAINDRYWNKIAKLQAVIEE